MKQCTKCRKFKDEYEFCKDTHQRSGLCTRCKNCTKEYMISYRQTEHGKKVIRESSRKFKKEHPDYNKEYKRNHNYIEKEYKRKTNLRKNYNITVEQYNEIFSKQEGKCAICGRHQNEFRKALAVDHDHTTKKIRGLLCENCNRGLGIFYDNVVILKTAIQYLTENQL